MEIAPLWGFACGVVTGAVTGVLAAFSGGPLGSGRLAAVGPSGWQAALVAALEVGISAAIAAGFANWLRLRRDPALAVGRASRAASDHREEALGQPLGTEDPAEDDGHRIYLNPWGDGQDGGPGDPPAVGPSALP